MKRIEPAEYGSMTSSTRVTDGIMKGNYGYLNCSMVRKGEKRARIIYRVN